MFSGDGATAYATIQRPQINLDAALPLPTALPINLLARRPDVLAARLQVDAADAQRLAANAAFYPDVSLRALAGFGAQTFSVQVTAIESFSTASLYSTRSSAGSLET